VEGPTPTLLFVVFIFFIFIFFSILHIPFMFYVAILIGVVPHLPFVWGFRFFSGRDSGGGGWASRPIPGGWRWVGVGGGTSRLSRLWLHVHAPCCTRAESRHNIKRHIGAGNIAT
jgi:hypothetical protein